MFLDLMMLAAYLAAAEYLLRPRMQLAYAYAYA